MAPTISVGAIEVTDLRVAHRAASEGHHGVNLIDCFNRVRFCGTVDSWIAPRRML